MLHISLGIIWGQLGIVPMGGSHWALEAMVPLRHPNWALGVFFVLDLCVRLFLDIFLDFV